jgi:putative transposase
VAVPTYQAFASTQLLDQLAAERMLAKLSTRRYPVGLEPVGTQVEQTATDTSRSAVSRRFVARTEHALAELLAQELSRLDLVAVMWTGSGWPSTTVWSSSASPSTAPRSPRSGRRRYRERHVARDLLAGLRDRGLDTTRPLLVVIDDAKALRRAVLEVFDHPVIQRLKLHELRNITDRLPDAVASTVAKRMRAAYRNPDPLVAQADLETLARSRQSA